MAIKRFNISAQEPALDKDGKFTLFWYNLFNRLAEFGGGTFVQSVGASSPLSSTGGDTPVIGLNDSAVTPGTYGDATHVGQFTVDQKGLLQFAANVPIALPVTSADYVVASDGVQPPTPLDDGLGQFVYVVYTP